MFQIILIKTINNFNSPLYYSATEGSADPSVNINTRNNPSATTEGLNNPNNELNNPVNRNEGSPDPSLNNPNIIKERWKIVPSFNIFSQSIDKWNDFESLFNQWISARDDPGKNKSFRIAFIDFFIDEAIGIICCIYGKI